MKASVPSSIKNQVAKKRIIRFSVFAVILLFLISLFLFFNPLSDLQGINKVLTFMFLLVINAAFTGVPFKLIHRSWQGEVVEVKVRTSKDSISSIKPTCDMQYTANTVILKLKTPKGETISVEAEKSKAKYSSSSIERYEPGDYVARIGGVDYLAHYRRKTNQVRCVICGDYSSTDNEACKHCASDLVQFTNG